MKSPESSEVPPVQRVRQKVVTKPPVTQPIFLIRYSGRIAGFILMMQRPPDTGVLPFPRRQTDVTRTQRDGVECVTWTLARLTSMPRIEYKRAERDFVARFRRWCPSHAPLTDLLQDKGERVEKSGTTYWLGSPKFLRVLLDVDIWKFSS